jgi:hypothetical protein
MILRPDVVIVEKGYVGTMRLHDSAISCRTYADFIFPDEANGKTALFLKSANNGLSSWISSIIDNDQLSRRASLPNNGRNRARQNVRTMVSRDNRGHVARNFGHACANH